MLMPLLTSMSLFTFVSMVMFHQAKGTHLDDELIALWAARGVHEAYKVID